MNIDSEDDFYKDLLAVLKEHIHRDFQLQLRDMLKMEARGELRRRLHWGLFGQLKVLR